MDNTNIVGITPDLDKQPLISAEEIINNYYTRLAIPNFQRGLIWTNDNIADLLESLYYETPCGCIILWEPPEKEDWKRGEPVPLIEPSCPYKKAQYFIIDGQQRIRSIYFVYNDKGIDDEIDEREDDSMTTGENDKSEKKVKFTWAIDLTQVDCFKDILEPRPKPSRLFMRIKDPLLSSENYRYKKNFFPLGKLWSDNDNSLNEYVEKWVVATKANEKIKEKIPCLREGVQRMLKFKAFFIRRVMIRRVMKKQYPEMVKLYNRVNGTGKPVEAEEKAYATLVSLYDATDKHIQDLFKNTHNHVKTTDMARDDYLKRMKEHSFGFKQYIRLFIQVCKYHLGSERKTNLFALSEVEDTTFSQIIKTEENAEQLWKETKEIVDYFANVRSGLFVNELKCDDWRFIPDIVSLWPVFQLLINFPKLKEHRELIAQLCIRMYLVEELTKDIPELVQKINNATGCKECIKAILSAYNKYTEKNLENYLSKKFKGVTTVQNRYVLLLYWLLRRNEISDFSYRNISDEEQREKRRNVGSEQEITWRSEPEKQHIVPVSKISHVFPDISSKRGKSDINNIGNITYISKALNRLLDNCLIDLSLESEDNLKAHLLHDDSIKTTYEQLKDNLQNKNSQPKDRETLEDLFEKFCEKRRKLIIEKICDWISDIDEEGLPQIGKNIPKFSYDAPTGDFLKFLEDTEMRNIMIKLNYWMRKTRRINVVKDKRIKNGELHYSCRKPPSQRKKIMKLIISSTNANELKLVFLKNQCVEFGLDEQEELARVKELFKDSFEIDENKEELIIHIPKNIDAFSKFEEIIEREILNKIINENPQNQLA